MIGASKRKDFFSGVSRLPLARWFSTVSMGCRSCGIWLDQEKGLEGTGLTATTTRPGWGRCFGRHIMQGCQWRKMGSTMQRSRRSANQRQFPLQPMPELGKSVWKSRVLQPDNNSGSPPHHRTTALERTLGQYRLNCPHAQVHMHPAAHTPSRAKYSLLGRKDASGGRSTSGKLSCSTTFL